MTTATISSSEYSETRPVELATVGEFSPVAETVQVNVAVAVQVSGHAHVIDSYSSTELMPASSTDPTRTKFERLRDRWLTETGTISVLSRRFMHEAYQQIIGMGSAIIPLLLEELRCGTGHWFWALRAITGENATQPGGSYQEAVDAWLQWGRDKKYID